MPPLRQRVEDVPLLVDHFVNKFNRKMGKEVKNIPKSTLKALQAYPWPGNVRELEHVIERGVIMTQGSVLRLFEGLEISDSNLPEETPVKSLVDVEQDHILRVLEKTDWRIEGKKGAAILLDLKPSTLRGRMRRLGISRHQPPPVNA